MGTDIHGVVECRTWQPGLEWDQTVWCATVDLELLGVHRDYGAFDRLFGMRSFGRWEPIAAGRGFPDAAADTTVMQALAEVHGVRNVRLVVRFDEWRREPTQQSSIRVLTSRRAGPRAAGNRCASIAAGDLGGIAELLGAAGSVRIPRRAAR